MRTRNYDTMYNKTTGNTENRVAVDEEMRHRPEDVARQFEEGFASASGVRNETAETGGRIKHPETKDEERSNRLGHRMPNPVDKENAGLADD